jgi:hypothetical protein
MPLQTPLTTYVTVWGSFSGLQGGNFRRTYGAIEDTQQTPLRAPTHSTQYS